MIETHPRFLELYHAIESQNISELQSLLSFEEYIVHLDWDEERLAYEAENQGHENLLLLAVIVANLDIIKILLEKGQNLPYWKRCLSEAIEKAAKTNQLETIEVLLEAGADPRRWVSVPSLVPASGTGNLELVQLLISSGADVNSSDEEGITPLMCAVVSGSFEIVELLLKHGAKIDEIQVDGWTTASYLARRYGHEEIYQLLENARNSR